MIRGIIAAAAVLILAGARFIVLMLKQGDKWVVRKKVRSWVS